ncbi:MAG: hypothetical protein IT558_05515, partial [Alphaproteobacteria bacterium]|nr:hypothetical protein [Alphaproteobacteria bacterium]
MNKSAYLRTGLLALFLAFRAAAQEQIVAAPEHMQENKVDPRCVIEPRKKDVNKAFKEVKELWKKAQRSSDPTTAYNTGVDAKNLYIDAFTAKYSKKPREKDARKYFKANINDFLMNKAREGMQEAVWKIKGAYIRNGFSDPRIWGHILQLEDWIKHYRVKMKDPAEFQNALKEAGFTFTDYRTFRRMCEF